MGISLIYRSPLLYRATMLGLYGRRLGERYRTLADLIPNGASVLELCCGPASLYWRHLRGKGVRYCGVDVNSKFVQSLTRAGAGGIVRDLRNPDPLPDADHVLMQAGLYQFLPDPAPLVDRMLAAARRQVIISEPVRNLADARVPLLSTIARRCTDPGIGRQQHRFNERTLDAFFSQYASHIRQTFLIAGGREKVYLLHPLADEDGSEAIHRSSEADSSGREVARRTV